jgi:hypothetical protein
MAVFLFIMDWPENDSVLVAAPVQRRIRGR